MKDDKDVVLAAVKKEGYGLEHASDALKNDKDVVLAAVKQDADALDNASAELKDDKDVVLAAAKLNLAVIGYLALKRNTSKTAVKACLVMLDSKRCHQEQLQLASLGFFGGAGAMAATLACSSTAYALVTGLIVFLPHVAAIALAVAVCGLAIALLALGVHAAISDSELQNYTPNK